MKLLDKLLLIYSTVLAITLTVTSLLSGFSLKNLSLMVLFLPVSGYFIYQLFQTHRLRQYRRKTNTPPQIENTDPSFSLKRFLSQKNPAFLVTLSLYFALLAALIVKTLVYLLPGKIGA
jgi:hypothetical protein